MRRAEGFHAMKTVQLEMKKCPSCGQLMLPTPDQTDWYCPECPREPVASAAQPRRASPPSSTARRAVAEPASKGPGPSASRGRRSAVLEPLVPSLDEDFEAGQLVGKVLGGRYRLESVLGQGAMGAVYRALQTTLKKPYAIKVLLPSLTHDQQFEARFQQEAQIAAAVRHPGLVEVFDYGMEGGLAYYVMEFLEGQTLSEALREREALDAGEAVDIVAAVADAVQVAHDHGVVHRDLKPANLFLARDSAGRQQVKVLDFGLSKAVASVLADRPPMTMAGNICGTPAYMSPEQAKGKAVDGRSDVYSLAVVLFRALTGKVPFDAAESLVVLYMHIDQAPPALADCRPGIYVPAALEEALYRALAKRPEERFRTMAEFAEALRRSVAAESASRSAHDSLEFQAPHPSRQQSRPSASSAGPSPSRGRLTPPSRAPAPLAPLAPSRQAPPRQGAPNLQGLAPLAADSLVSRGPIFAGSEPELSPVAPERKPPPPRRPPPPSRGGAPGAQGVAPLAPESMVLPAAAVPAAVREYSPAAPSAPPRSGREKNLFIAAAAVIAVIALAAVALLVAGGRRQEIKLPEKPLPVEALPPVSIPTPAPGPTSLDEQPIEDGPMAPSIYSKGKAPAPKPTPRPLTPSAAPPRPKPAEAAPAAKAKLVLTSKVSGRVLAAVGSQRVELGLNAPRLLDVPAGRLRLTFAVLDAASAACAVAVEIQEGQQDSFVFGPEPGVVWHLSGAAERAKVPCR